jgi:hypothetical protein
MNKKKKMHRKEESAERKQPSRQHHAQIGNAKNWRQGDLYVNEKNGNSSRKWPSKTSKRNIWRR